jgi:hypothetical protein
VTLDYQIVFDCTDPHSQARFWAAATGYEVEDNSPLIDGLLAAGAVPEDATVVYQGQREWVELVAIRHPDDPVDDRSGAGRGRRMLFQQVPEAKTVKNRVHLDLRVGTDALETQASRLEALGAQVVRRASDRGSTYITMTDPEGNEFDIH